MKGLTARKPVPPFAALALFAAFLCAGISAPAAHAGQAETSNYAGLSVEASPQIFAVLCALDAAGFSADEDALANMPARLALRGQLRQMQGPTIEALQRFYHDHAVADPAETLSPYITFALVIGPPPNFEFQMEREALPPDVVSLEGFQELLVRFYREAHLDVRWARVEPEYEPAVGRDQAALHRIVSVTNGYLREIVKPFEGRTFAVYVEPLVGAQTNFRIQGDHYAIVVGASGVPQDAIQHAYLHFMLDPLVLRERRAIDARRSLLDIATRAPLLPAEYREDFIALVDECLIKAVELRLRRPAPAALEAALREADESGFVLVRPLVSQLQKFEKDQPAMSYYFPDMIAGLNVDAERKRLQQVTFASAERPVPQHSVGPDAETSEMDRLLAQGNRQLASQDPAAAAATFEQALAKHPDDPRALYGLAIASVLSGQASRARELFEKIVSAPGPAASAPADPAILAWAHVYLGRIHDLEREREAALKEYRAALAVEGAPDAARTAAQRGVETAYEPPQAPRGNN